MDVRPGAQGTQPLDFVGPDQQFVDHHARLCLRVTVSGDGGSANVCEGQTGRLNGMAVQKYWSDNDGECILPQRPIVVRPVEPEITIRW